MRQHSDPVKYENSCALRLSYTLNKSGADISYTKDETGSGSDGKWYFYRVSDLEKYLKRHYGTPDVNSGSKSSFMNLKGIIIFRVTGWSNATGHFTLWDGSKVGHGDYFSLANSVSLWKAN